MDSDLRKSIEDEAPDLGVEIEALLVISISLSHAADSLNDGEVGDLGERVSHVYDALVAHQLQDERDREDQVERLRTIAGITRARRGWLLAEITKISKEVRADYYHDLHPGIDSHSIRLRETADALDHLAEKVASEDESKDKFEKLWSRPSPFGHPFTPTTTPSAPLIPCLKPGHAQRRVWDHE